MTRSSRLLALLLVCIVTACGGGSGGGGRTPTEPTVTSKRLDIVFNLVPNFVSGGGAIEGAVYLDGREVGRTNWVTQQGGACAFLCQIALRADNVSEGNHTVEVQIVAQTRNMVRYTIQASGSVGTPGTGQVRNFTLPVQDVTLRAGQRVSYSVDV